MSAADCIIIGTGGHAGFLIDYEVLKLFPASDCGDLANGCRMDSLGLGFVMGF